MHIKNNAFLFSSMKNVLSLKMKEIVKPISKIIKNALYFPLIKFLIYNISNDFFLSSIIIQKLYVSNYYYNFSYLYNHIPKKYIWIKQFIRFTDTGHIVSFLYYFYPNFLPIAHNVHFLITFGYWISKFVFDMIDLDDIPDEGFIKWFGNLWSYANHGLIYILLAYQIIKKDYYQNSLYSNYFTNYHLFYTYLWVYTWFIFIYLPWRYYTKDEVYSILSNKESIKNKILIVIMIHIFIYIANIFGYFMYKYL